jgi:hypothetical protein
MSFLFNLSFDVGHVTSTSIGTRRVQEAIPTEEFWNAWRTGKEGLQAKGFSVAKDATGWKVKLWTAPTQAPPETKSATLPVPLPPLRNARGLLPWQPLAVRTLLRAAQTHGAALDASDTGVGKTYAALAVARELEIRPVVVATRNTVVAWERVAKQMGVDVALVSTWDRVKMGNTPAGTKVGDGFRWNSKVQLLILDEVHRASGAATQNAELVIAAKRQGIPTLALSASAADSPMQMRAIGYLLGLHDDKGFLQWMMSHGCYLDNFEKWRFGGTQEDLLSIHHAIFPEKGVRLRKDEIPGFPATQITAELVPVETPEAVSKAYADLHEAIRRIRAKEVTEVDKANHLTAMLRANQVTELAKVPPTIERIQEWVSEGLSVVVGVQFTDTIKTLANSLGKIPVATITGADSDKARQKAVDSFQADKTRVMVMNQAVEGVGLHDIRGRHPRGTLLLPGFRPLAVKQFLGRVHRAEGKSKSIQRVLFAAGCPVEERKAERLTERLRGMSILNDGVDVPLTEDDLMGLF